MKERYILVHISGLEVTKKALKQNYNDLLAACTESGYSNYIPTSEQTFDTYAEAMAALNEKKIIMSDLVTSPNPFYNVDFWYIRKEVYNEEFAEWKIPEDVEEEFAEIETIEEE